MKWRINGRGLSPTTIDCFQHFVAYDWTLISLEGGPYEGSGDLFLKQ